LGSKEESLREYIFNINKMEVGVGVSELEINVDEEEEESGERKVKKVQNPVRPRAEDVEEHEMTHLPFRSWCRHCVRGRGEELGHHACKELPEQMEVHMDYCFPGEDGSDKSVTMLVVRERLTRMTMCTATPTKTTGEFIAKRVVAFLREIGGDHVDITVKSDQEPAMNSLIREVGRHRAAGGGGRMVVEASPKGDSKGNGIVERAIKSVEAQVRVMRSALEDRIKGKLEADHPVFPWMAEYGALLINRFEVGKDGMTAYERNKKKKAKTLGLEFGEALLWKRKPIWGTAGQAHVHVGGRRLLGGQGHDGGDYRGHHEGHMEDEVREEEAGGRQVERGQYEFGRRSAMEDEQQRRERGRSSAARRSCSTRWGPGHG
jgi:hypothetical protein